MARIHRQSVQKSFNHNDTVTHLEPDILECEVMYALGIITRNKASGGDGIPAELLQDDVEVLHSLCQQIWKTQQQPQTGKSVFHSNPKEGQCQRMFKLPHNCTHFTCQQDYTQNPSSQASAVREPRDSRCTSWIQKQQRNQRSGQHPLDRRKSKRIPEKKNIVLCH